MDDWRLSVAGDGTPVEFVASEWEPDDGTEPPGTIRMRVHYLLNGEAGSKVVLLTSADLEASGE
jgi:hypothetical protein